MKKAILVVSFGTSYWNTLENTIGATEATIARCFPQWQVRRAFTSGMIIRKIEQRDGTRIPTVPQALEDLCRDGYTRVVIQPTHMMHGQEYEKLCAMVRPFENRLTLQVSRPLLHETDDYERVTAALLDWYPQREGDTALVLMGHGTAHYANSAYAQLDYMLSEKDNRVFVGTVEGYPALEQVITRLKTRPEIKRIILAPLMLVAGDHAQNDMAGEEDSWKWELEKLGYDVTCILQGLGQCPKIREIFADHCARTLAELEAWQGTLYGVGVGPGDPELLTLKAVRILRQSDVVLVPDTGKSRQAALEIVRTHLEGKTVEMVSTPMTRDRDVVEAGYTRIADRICDLLEQGKQVAYVTLGDPTIYSTYIYVHNRVLERGYTARIVPGVPSFCAAAARLNTGLCQGEESLLVIPALATMEGEKQTPVNRVYMKAGKEILQLQQQLADRGALEGAAMVENCGMEDERVYPHFADLDQPSGYFSLVISKGETP